MPLADCHPPDDRDLRPRRARIPTRALGAREQEELLGRWIAAEPRLGLASRCAERGRQRWCLIDPERLLARARRRLARLGRTPPGAEEPPGGERIDPGDGILAEIDAALDELLREDAEAEARGARGAAPCELPFLTCFLGLPSSASRAASVRFHALPARARRAFFAMVVELRDPAQCAGQDPGAREELRTDVAACLVALGLLEEPPVPRRPDVRPRPDEIR